MRIRDRVYDEFETNEIMYPKVETGASEYDVICPSDYMISKMIENDLLSELNFDNMPNAKANIGEQMCIRDRSWGTSVKIQ